MDEIHIEGGKVLQGSVAISGSKNAALPLLALCAAVDGVCTISNVPLLKDVDHMLEILRLMGATVTREKSTVMVDARSLNQTEAPYDYVRKMRASVVMLGPLLARYRKAQVSLPGGCAIGVRPIDLHLKAFQAMGATVKIQNGDVQATLENSKEGEFFFDRVTVTGTINALILAASLPHPFVLDNCATEPEVQSVALALVSMGATIQGIGTSRLEVKGCKAFAPLQWENIPDRIEAGTYLCAALMTGGHVEVTHVNPQHCKNILSKLSELGALIEVSETSIAVKSPSAIAPVDVRTAPYPGFPTDMQAQVMAVLCLAKGKSVVTETIFENRFMHVPELNRMGASIAIKGATATVDGVSELKAAPVMATDLRASACLVLAGLAAKGTTKVLRVYHLDRGYEHLTQKFQSLGANIKRAG
ncbi:MAG: UDP-N-acetylglucosamine 1-carboxyvinyltransferase [Bdellovibrionota bacterium]